MIGANVVGAAIVFALIVWVLPLPSVDDAADARQANAVALVGYLLVAVPVGALWVLRLLRPMRDWLRADRPPTEAEQRLTLLMPVREVVVHGTLWGIAAVGFTVLNL